MSQPLFHAPRVLHPSPPSSRCVAAGSGEPSWLRALRWSALAVCLSCWLGASAMASEGSPGDSQVTSYGAIEIPSASHKADSFSDRLLLPYFEVDTTNPFGSTTLFAIRNEAGAPVDITLDYYEVDSPQAPQRSEMMTLAAKAISTVNLRFVPNLEVDPGGISRGYVIVGGPESASLHGDYYQVTPNQDFATGFRLLNIDPQSSQNDLCNLFSMRFLNGGGFDSGTEYLIWLDLSTVPSGAQPVLDILAYTQAGGEPFMGREFFADTVAFKVSASDLLQPLSQDFGAIEFQFRNGVVGHVSAVQSASNRYSVGLEAACGDL